MVDLSSIPGIAEPHTEPLNQRQLIDYESYRESFVKWLLAMGKDPEQVEGYAEATVKRGIYRTDEFHHWVWNQRGYTTTVTPEDADEYMQEMAYSDYSDSHKANTQKAIKRLMKYRHYEHGGEEWNPTLTFSSGGNTSAPREYLTYRERQKIREAALEYGSIPAYNGLTPEQREEWKAYVAQSLMKPKSKVNPEDWKRINGWKIPSMVWVSLDAGLRPIEVERAVTTWVDTENCVLRIPRAESSKNEENWVVALQDRTSEALKRWLEQRERIEKYEDTDALWLTRQGNSYQSQSLRRLLHNLCETAGISTKDRKLSWYAIRHSVGTYMTREEDLAAAQAQLRHKSEQTTMKYDQAPVEERKNALNRMG